MIRFPQFLIARLWTDEYGDPDVAEEFAWLHAYSPYHHVDRRRRVPGGAVHHGRGRLAGRPAARPQDGGDARLGELQPGASDPILLRQSGRSGHGQGKPANMRVRDDADVLAFLCWQLGVEAMVDARL